MISKATDFTQWVKGGVLMIIHIYAKVSTLRFVWIAHFISTERICASKKIGSGYWHNFLQYSDRIIAAINRKQIV
ncbi:hypothetical protein SPONL_355 [uncultured Candidatus Thioglobus sp.]|nr:hypothetical protein SPONL_355 [uncultured Candidatus Thioglobus sp.]